jgi:hypothetical protein
MCFVAKVTEEDVRNYLEFLEKRVDDIEKVIEHHFGLIKETIREERRNQMVKSAIQIQSQGKKVTAKEKAVIEKSIIKDLEKDREL